MFWKTSSLALVLLALLAVSGMSSAHDIIRGDECVVADDEVIAGDVFVLCRTFRLDGVIQGNLFGAAFYVEINGSVTNDVYVIAGQLDVSGELGEDLLFGGAVLRVHDGTRFTHARSNLIGAALSTTIFDNVAVPDSIVLLGYQLIINGSVDGAISFWGSALYINGPVGGNVTATVGDPDSDASQLQTLLIPFRLDVQLIRPGLVVTQNARVDGQLTYSAPARGRIDGALAQEAVFNEIITRPDFTQINLDDEENTTWLTLYLTEALREAVTLGLIGLAGLVMGPRTLQAPIANLRWRPFSSVGIGILTFLMSFAAFFALFVLLALAVLFFLFLRLGDMAIISLMAIGALNIGGASTFYFVAIYLSRVVVCLAIGRVIIWYVLGDDGTARIQYFSLGAGISLLALLVYLPFVGALINLLALAFGLGAIALMLLRTRTTTGQRRPLPVTPPDQSIDLRQIPPPTISDTPASGPGMDNLPEGFSFRWWSNED
jgi:hypothetical protein